MWRAAFLLFFLFVNNAFAKSCLRNLPSGHHAVVASYDEAMRCVIKSCIVSYKLFHNKCIKKTQYEDLIEKEKTCVESGGTYDYLTYPAEYLKCFCPTNKININDECISYNENDCETERIIEQHIEKNNLQSVKKCIEKNKNVVKGLEQQTIESALKTQNYEILDFLLDNGLDLNIKTVINGDIAKYFLINAGVYNNIVRSWHSANSEISYDTNEIEYVVDLTKNFDLIKHLVEEKHSIDLNDDQDKLFVEQVASYHQYYAYGTNVAPACDTLSFCLDRTDSHAVNNTDILGKIMYNISHSVSDHKGFPLEYLKCARFKGLKFKLKNGNNPLDYLTPAPNLGPQEYQWLITEIKTDLPDVDFTSALKKFCYDDYVYGPPPRTLQEDKDIIQVFLDTGVQINDDIIKAAKDYQMMVNKNAPTYDDGSDASNWYSHKFDAVCSFAPENEICIANKKNMEELQKAHEEVKAREQSLANRTLTAAATAVTGIGGMQLAQGLAEQKADKAADQDMSAYIASFRCEYGDGKQVKGGPDEIELPGGNDETLLKYRNEYIALAADLKERKEALGMKPGIESEVILDKAQIGLYDNESTGITGGAYSSLYRAKMLDSETDQTKIDEDKEKSKKRVIAGGVLSGVGVAGGMIGNSLINGKLGEMIKDSKNTTSKTNTSVINKLKKGLKSTGMTGVDKLDFSNLDLSSMSSIINKIDFSSMSGLKGKNATDILNTSNSSSFTSSFSDILGNENMSLFQ